MKQKTINDELLASLPSPKGSMRCGKGNCEYYDKFNKVSGCKIFDDRRKCIRSNKQRRTSATTSKGRKIVRW